MLTWIMVQIIVICVILLTELVSRLQHMASVKRPVIHSVPSIRPIIVTNINML